MKDKGQNSQERLPPQNIEAEEALLGSLLISPGAVVRVATIIKPEDFYREKNGWVFDAALHLMGRGEPVDLMTLCNVMESREQLAEIGGPAFLASLIDTTPTSIHAEHYARIVAEKAARRRLIDAAGRAAALGYSEDGDVDEDWSSALKEIVAVRRDNGSGPVSIQDAVSRHYDRTEAVARADEKPFGIPSGFKDLDGVLRGFQRQDMTILAARPSQGKTSLGLGFAAAACRAGFHTALFSVEMSEEAILTRLISQESGVPFEDIRDGHVGARWDLYTKTAGEIASWPLWIDDTGGISPGYLRAELMRLDALHGIDFAIVDYVQLMSADGRHPDLRHAVTANSGALKRIGKDLNIPLVVLSQLSRAVEQRQDKRPLLSDLRESGSLEQDADVVIFIYRDEVYDEFTERPGIADIIVAKHRNGRTDTVSLLFNGPCMRFENAEIRRQELI